MRLVPRAASCASIRSPLGSSASIALRSPLPASSHITPDGTATRVAQRHRGVLASSRARSRKPRHLGVMAAIDAGVRLNPGCPDTGSTSGRGRNPVRSEEHTSELQSLMRISYAVFCLKKKKTKQKHNYITINHDI